MNNLFLESGYLDWNYIMNDDNPFTVIVSARGVGKTYGCLEWIKKEDKKFALLRLTDKESQFCANPAGNPFKALNRDHDWTVEVKRINQYMYGFYENKESNDYLGLLLSLSTFSRIRGADLSDIEYEIIDEFIPETIVKKISGMGEAVLQSYETINRNRELQGHKPLKLIMMANALNINNEILIKFGLVSILQKMKKKNLEIYRDTDRGITVIFPQSTPISEMKRDTALYRISERFNKMALDNQFREYYELNIGSRRIHDYKLITGFDNIYFYKSKADGSHYVTSFLDKKQKLQDYYGNTDFEIIQFRKKYWYYIDAYYNNRIKFESAENELDFINLFKIQ